MRLRHNFIDILVIAICAVLCGVETWEGMVEFGGEKQAWLSTFLELPHGIPSHDTFYRVFCLLTPEVFEECFTRWITDTLRQFTGDGLDIFPIDGKCLLEGVSWENYSDACLSDCLPKT